MSSKLLSSAKTTQEGKKRSRLQGACQKRTPRVGLAMKTSSIILLAMAALPATVLPFTMTPTLTRWSGSYPRQLVLSRGSVDTHVSMRASTPDGLPDRTGAGLPSSAYSSSTSFSSSSEKPSRLRRVLNFIRLPFLRSQHPTSEPVQPIATRREAVSDFDDLLSFASEPIDVTQPKKLNSLPSASKDSNAAVAREEELDMMTELRKRMKDSAAGTSSSTIAENGEDAATLPKKPARRKLYDNPKKAGSGSAGSVAGSVLERPGTTPPSSKQSPPSSAGKKSTTSMSDYAKRKAARKAKAQASPSATIDLDSLGSSGASNPKGAPQAGTNPTRSKKTPSDASSDKAPVKPSLASAEEIERMNRLFGISPNEDQE